MNFIHIAGHMGADPEVRFTSTGKKVTTLRVACRTRRGQKEDTIWWRVTLWGEQFDKMIPHLKKGSGVMVFGELHKPEIFNDREGKPQASMEITALQVQFSPFGRPQGQQGGQSTHSESAHAQETPPANPYMGAAPAGIGASAPQGETFDDEVPF